MTWEAMESYTLANVSYLKRAWEDSGRPDLIIIDPPTNFMGQYDEHVNAEVRKMLGPLTRWLVKIGSVCCALISHINKNITEGLAALDRVMGSVAWTTTPRIVVGFVKDPKDPTKCICGGLKNNLGETASSLSYLLDKRACPDRVEWLGESATTADDAMLNTGRQTAGQKAARWVTECFREKREWWSNELRDLALAAGHSTNAVFKSEEVRALPIRKRPVDLPDGSRQWKWSAMDAWPE
jgi:hypothetical protein